MELLLEMSERENHFLNARKTWPKKELKKAFKGAQLNQHFKKASFVCLLVRDVQIRYENNVSIDDIIGYVETYVQKRCLAFHEQYESILVCLMDIKTKMIQRSSFNPNAVEFKSSFNPNAVEFNPNAVEFNPNAVEFNPMYDISSTCAVDTEKLEPPAYVEPPAYHIAINNNHNGMEDLMSELPPAYDA